MTENTRILVNYRLEQAVESLEAAKVLLNGGVGPGQQYVFLGDLPTNWRKKGIKSHFLPPTRSF